MPEEGLEPPTHGLWSVRVWLCGDVAAVLLISVDTSAALGQRCPARHPRAYTPHAEGVASRTGDRRYTMQVKARGSRSIVVGDRARLAVQRRAAAEASIAVRRRRY